MFSQKLTVRSQYSSKTDDAQFEAVKVSQRYATSFNGVTTYLQRLARIPNSFLGMKGSVFNGRDLVPRIDSR